MGVPPSSYSVRPFQYILGQENSVEWGKMWGSMQSSEKENVTVFFAFQC